jgi:hypothetical protein
MWGWEIRDSDFASRASRSRVRVSGGAAREHLDRDLAIQTGVARAIDLAHATGSEGRDDLVPPEADAELEGHAVARIPDPRSLIPDPSS